MKKTNESGRSMVEMLGVLAIIGVLSTVVMTGYTTALNKHKANQILNGASVRAMVASTQIQRGVETPTLGGFPDDTIGGATFENSVKNTAGTGDWNKETDKRFSLALTGVDEDICTQIKAMMGENGIIRDISQNCTTITYNNDLTATTFITDNKNSSSCESAGGVWNESKKSCVCPGRYTGSNCEIAPTSCPSGATTTEDGKCEKCVYDDMYAETRCTNCEVWEESICTTYNAACTCYNPKTQNIKCDSSVCITCNKNSTTPTPYIGSRQFCYNENTQNFAIRDYNYILCDKGSEKPDAVCDDTSTGTCYCYNSEKQNRKCGKAGCIICDKDSKKPTPYVSENFWYIFCYNENTQNVAENPHNYILCDKNSEKPDAICADEEGCICYNAGKQNVKCGFSTCKTCEKNSTTPIARCEDDGTCSCVAEQKRG